MDHTRYQYNAPEIDPRFSPQPTSPPPPFPQDSFYTASHPMNKQYDGTSYGYAGNVYPTHASYGSSDAKEATVFMQHDRAEMKPERRRCCGMRRGYFIVLLAVIILLVIAGVVLGVVFGVVLPKQNATSDVKVVEKTGLATATAADDSRKTYVYFQDSDNNIHENLYYHHEWSLDEGSKTDGGIVTGAAAPKSPLAAVSYEDGGQIYRQVFFITSSGKVKTVRRTETKGWSSPKTLMEEPTAVNSVALAACAAKDIGAHVFYGALHQGTEKITAIQANLNSDQWYRGYWFDDSDAVSGVACSTHPNAQLNLYLRNSTSKAVEQQYLSYDISGIGWWQKYDPDRSSSNYPIAFGSDIAICEDEQHTEYVFWQEESGQVVRGVVNPHQFNFEGYRNVPHTEGATVGSKMAASYINGGSFLMYQERDSASEVSTVGMTRNGVLLSSGVMGG